MKQNVKKTAMTPLSIMRSLLIGLRQEQISILKKEITHIKKGSDINTLTKGASVSIYPALPGLSDKMIVSMIRRSISQIIFTPSTQSWSIYQSNIPGGLRVLSNDQIAAELIDLGWE